MLLVQYVVWQDATEPGFVQTACAGSCCTWQTASSSPKPRSRCFRPSSLLLSGLPREAPWILVPSGGVWMSGLRGATFSHVRVDFGDWWNEPYFWASTVPPWSLQCEFNRVPLPWSYCRTDSPIELKRMVCRGTTPPDREVSLIASSLISRLLENFRIWTSPSGTIAAS